MFSNHFKPWPPVRRLWWLVVQAPSRRVFAPSTVPTDKTPFLPRGLSQMVMVMAWWGREALLTTPLFPGFQQHCTWCPSSSCWISGPVGRGGAWPCGRPSGKGENTLLIYMSNIDIPGLLQHDRAARQPLVRLLSTRAQWRKNKTSFLPPGLCDANHPVDLLSTKAWTGHEAKVHGARGDGADPHMAMPQELARLSPGGCLSLPRSRILRAGWLSIGIWGPVSARGDRHQVGGGEGCIACRFV